jgi:triosephosphate isomerase
MAREKTYIIGNWKMNNNVHEGSLLVHKLSTLVKVRRDVEVVLAPTVLGLQSLSLQVNRRQFKLAAQNFYWRDHGAFTGEVSAAQLKGLVEYALVGHSERRHVFGEHDKDIRSKVQAALRNDIKPVLCVGETATERANNETKDVLADQIVGGLANVTSEEISKVVVAYEPVWAIGTGDFAGPDDVIAAVRTIRSQVKHLFGEEAAMKLPILYGGSVSLDNANAFLSIPEVDGLLIGGASLDSYIFSEIVKLAHKPNTKIV